MAKATQMSDLDATVVALAGPLWLQALGLCSQALLSLYPVS